MRKAISYTISSVNVKCNTANPRRNARTNDTRKDQWQRKQAGSTRLGGERGCAWQGQRREALWGAIVDDLIDSKVEQMEQDVANYRSWTEGEDLFPPCYSDQDTTAKVQVHQSVRNLLAYMVVKDAIAAERAELDALEDRIEEWRESVSFYG